MEMKNRILFTVDGRKQGNAICTGNLAKNRYYEIITDYGNTAKLSIREISEMFNFGEIALPSHKNYTL